MSNWKKRFTKKNMEKRRVHPNGNQLSSSAEYSSFHQFWARSERRRRGSVYSLELFLAQQHSSPKNVSANQLLPKSITWFPPKKPTIRPGIFLDGTVNCQKSGWLVTPVCSSQGKPSSRQANYGNFSTTAIFHHGNFSSRKFFTTEIFSAKCGKFRILSVSAQCFESEDFFFLSSFWSISLKWGSVFVLRERVGEWK